MIQKIFKNLSLFHIEQIVKKLYFLFVENTHNNFIEVATRYCFGVFFFQETE